MNAGRFHGKVALITGAARGQGASHAARLAEEGADIVAIDVCGDAAPLGYPPATAEDLERTVSSVQQHGRRVIAEAADVRDLQALHRIVARATDEFGGIDIVVANAGICSWGTCWEMPEEQWAAMIDINLTGAWKTIRAVVPGMIERGHGGSIVLISSVAALKSLPGLSHYSAAKAGMVGLANAAAIELGQFRIRVNTIHPWTVTTPMSEDQTRAPLTDQYPQFGASFASVLGGAAEPSDISDAVLWLASEESRTVTGTQLTVDLGATKV